MYISDDNATPSENVRMAGFNSMKELSKKSGMSVATLRNWFKNRRFVFDAVVNHVIRTQGVKTPGYMK